MGQNIATSSDSPVHLKQLDSKYYNVTIGFWNENGWHDENSLIALIYNKKTGKLAKRKLNMGYPNIELFELTLYMFCIRHHNQRSGRTEIRSFHIGER